MIEFFYITINGESNWWREESGRKHQQKDKKKDKKKDLKMDDGWVGLILCMMWEAAMGNSSKWFAYLGAEVRCYLRPTGFNV